VPTTDAATSDAPGRAEKMMFWGCFIALITTSFAFVGRLFLIKVWATEFNLDPAEVGRLAGIGIWPFALSIILFSLIIDKIGYKTAMFFAFGGHLIWTVMGVAAYFVKDTNPELGFQLLYWGSLIVALANGTVEAFINPVVATMFSKEKTKWLNILHAGWPAGLVITGLLLIGIDANFPGTPWAVKIGLLGVPAVIYFLMLVGLKFPQSERVTSGVSYRDMLREFGVGGALVVSVLLVLQLIDFFSNGGSIELAGTTKGFFVGIGVLMVAAFGAYTKSFGRPILLFLIVIMMPLATTEIGTDGWITGIMDNIAKAEEFHPGWILVYTSAIMLVLRFLAGPIVHALSPLGLLTISAVLAIAGLTFLSTAQGTMILVAATLYGFGKTFFWPTMLGVVSEQCPKGGALTLNAISGIGMLAVGTLGFPYIGTLQTKAEQSALVENTEVSDKVPGLVVDGEVQPVTEKRIYEVITYKVIDGDQLDALYEKVPADKQDAIKAEVQAVRAQSSQRSLADMAIFPSFMLACYIGLLIYFKSAGGYQAEVLAGHEADDEKFTGGVDGAVE
jgi:MFS family permease